MGGLQQLNGYHMAVQGLPEKASVDPACSSGFCEGCCKGFESNHRFRLEPRPNSSSSEELDLSSLSSEEVRALPATVLIGGASRCVGTVSQNGYEKLDGEDEETDSSSSLTNSGEFAPLDFTVVLGGPSKALYKPKTVSYFADDFAESDTELSFSDAPLVVTVRDNRGQASAQIQKQKSIEAHEFEFEVETKEEDGEEKQLNAIVISNLVKRLRDPNIEVAASEFANLEWDDPNFEEELRTLKQLASYTEVKETMMKTANDSILESSSLINQKIKDAVMMLPEIRVVRVKDQSVEQMGASGASNKIGKESVSPTSPKKPILGAQREKIIMVGNNGKVTVLSKEAHTGSCAARKRKMTESMILTAGGAEAAASFKEARMGSCTVEQRKRKDHLLTSQHLNFLPKEAAFGEEEKLIHRKRRESLGHQLLRVYEVPEVNNEEIVEPEYATTEAVGSGTKNESNETRRLARKKEVSRGNRAWSSIGDALVDKTTTGHILNREASLLTKNTRDVAKKRRRRGGKNRSITFADMVEVEDTDGFVETSEAYAISSPFPAHVPAKPSVDEKTRPRRLKSALRSSLVFSAIPDKLTDAVGEKDQTTHIPLSSTRISRESSWRTWNPGDASPFLVNKNGYGADERTTDGKTSQKKTRHRPTPGRQKLRSIEYSLVADEGLNEIADPEDGLELTNGNTITGSQLGEKRLLVHQECVRDTTSRFLPPLGSGTSWKHRARPRRSLNASSSLTELPVLRMNEISDAIMDPKSAAKMSNHGESVLSAPLNARKCRRVRSNNPNRSSTSFAFLPEEEIIELKENVEESIDQSASRGNPLAEGTSHRQSSRPRGRKHSSAACSMVSIDISEWTTMEDNLDDTFHTTCNRQKIP